jgi:hypothetical protein
VRQGTHTHIQRERETERQRDREREREREKQEKSPRQLEDLQDGWESELKTRKETLNLKAMVTIKVSRYRANELFG